MQVQGIFYTHNVLILVFLINLEMQRPELAWIVQANVQLVNLRMIIVTLVMMDIIIWLQILYAMMNVQL